LHQAIHGSHFFRGILPAKQAIQVHPLATLSNQGMPAAPKLAGTLDIRHGLQQHDSFSPQRFKHSGLILRQREHA